MEQFPSSGHFSPWAGVSPGNSEGTVKINSISRKNQWVSEKFSRFRIPNL